MSRRFTSLEVGAGVGGQALGLERAGFDPVVLIDNDRYACATLRENRPHWRVLEMDFKDFVGEEQGITTVDLLSGGVPSTPYSVAGRQEGIKDRRDLLTAAICLAIELQPRAILLETTPSLLTSKFVAVREEVEAELKHLGYDSAWNILDAQHFGVPQTRRSCLLVAMRASDFARFAWPEPSHERGQTVGEVLRESMASRGWPDADRWALRAREVAPTIVGGSKKHGGADLGPSRTKQQWLRLGVNGNGMADDVPDADFVLQPEIGREGLPKLTVAQVMKLQALPDDWFVAGRKTARYRQVAQAFPPPLAEALGRQIVATLT